MVPGPELLTPAHATTSVRVDGRPQPEFREHLRAIPSWHNAWSVVSVWVQAIVIVGLAVWWANPVGYVVAFLLMGRTQAQLAALMHEAAHRLLFANRRVNDIVGRWFLGYPSFTSTDAYRRVHMAHHRQEFGLDEPDIPLYAGYPISHASFRRKLVRDATGRTGFKLMRAQFAGFRSADPRVRHTLWKILAVQAVLLGAAVAGGVWWVYPVFWLLPFLTVWRVINRLRSIAEHGGMDASADRRATTHTVRQSWLARSVLVPFHIGWHLAHHVDAGVPMRHLPEFHRALRDAGYVTPALEYPGYRALWRALRAGTPPSGAAST
jgi:fatty acid desaturase